MRNTDGVDFQTGYKVAMLWANAYTDDPETGEYMIADEHPDLSPSIWDFTPEAAEAAHDDCEAFLNMTWKGHSVVDLIESATGYGWEQAGHDFALTRNHHGAGFWDRGLGEAGDLLTEAAETFGESNLWVDAETGQVHAE